MTQYAAKKFQMRQLKEFSCMITYNKASQKMTKISSTLLYLALCLILI